MDSVLSIFFIFGTPAIAIIGGILAAILKTRGQQRLMELAQRERIAAIERGLDLTQLPPLPVLQLSSRESAIRRAQGLLIGGLVSVALGVGLIATLLFMPNHDGGDAWAIGFVPAAIGIALLIASRVIRREAADL